MNLNVYLRVKIFNTMIINDFNKTLDKWLLQLQHYDIATLIIKADSDNWSLGQVYMHLIAETTWYFSQIRLCFDTLSHAEKEMTESAKQMFKNNSLPSLQIKGDPVIAKNIPQPTDVHTLKIALKKLKVDAATLWVTIEQKETYGKSKHPGLQYLSPKEWLQFAEMHMRHHFNQKDSIDNYLKNNI